MTAVLEPRHVHPRRWHQAIAVARETCARYFLDGRSPADAMQAHGFIPSGDVGWGQAVNLLAELHLAPQEARQVA
jgi:hypothetical protein